MNELNAPYPGLISPLETTADTLLQLPVTASVTFGPNAALIVGGPAFGGTGVGDLIGLNHEIGRRNESSRQSQRDKSCKQ